MERVKERLRELALPLVAAAVIFLLIYGGIRYLLPVVLPFAIAFLLAVPIRKIAHEIAKKLHVSYRVCGLFLVVFILLLVFSLIGFFVYRLVNEGIEGLRYLSENPEIITGILDTVEEFFNGILEKLPFIGGEEGGKQGASDIVREGIYEGIRGVAAYLGGAIEHLPGIFVSLTVTVVTTVYCVVDEERLHGALESLLPIRVREAWKGLQARVLTVLGRCLRAYCILFLVNFLLLFLGLTLLRVKYAVLLAFLFSVVDLLPVVGVGIALIPWGIYEIIVGNVGFGIGLFVLYVVIAVLRQWLEPRLVGRGSGLHPLLIFALLIIGGRLFGFVGLLLFPVAALVLYEVKTSETGERGDGEGTKDAREEKKAPKT